MSCGKNALYEVARAFWSLLLGVLSGSAHEVTSISASFLRPEVCVHTLRPVYGPRCSTSGQSKQCMNPPPVTDSNKNEKLSTT